MARKSNSRTARWQEACQAARNALDAIEAAKADLEAAFSDLGDLKAEYEDWQSNLPDSLQSSPVADKLQAVVDLDTDWDSSSDLDDAASLLDELEAADLPLGFGRD